MEDARNGDAEKGIPQHVPKKMANQKLSKESELREGKNEKKRKRDLPRQQGQDILCSQKSKQGNQWFPGKPRKLHYKRRGWVVKKGQRKSEKERRNSLEKELSEKIKSEEKILRENKILLPGIL